MTKIPVNKDPREEKRRIAGKIRERLDAHDILAVNLISSPGSGKTTLLERTLPLLDRTVRLAVIEADCATDNDAVRLRKLGISVEMIASAITGCHISPAAARTAFDALDFTGAKLDIGHGNNADEAFFAFNAGSTNDRNAHALGNGHLVGYMQIVGAEDFTTRNDQKLTVFDAPVLDVLPDNFENACAVGNG